MSNDDEKPIPPPKQIFIRNVERKEFVIADPNDELSYIRTVRGVPFIGPHKKFKVPWPANYKLYRYQRYDLKPTVSPEKKAGTEVVTLDDYECKNTESPNSYILTSLDINAEMKGWFFIQDCVLEKLILCYKRVEDENRWTRFNEIIADYMETEHFKKGENTGYGMIYRYEDEHEEMKLSWLVDEVKTRRSTRDIPSRANRGFMILCALATVSQRGIPTEWDCLARTWEGELGCMIYIRPNPQFISPEEIWDLLKAPLGEVEDAKRDLASLRDAYKQLKGKVETRETFEPKEEWYCLGQHLLGYYQIWMEKTDWEVLRISDDFTDILENFSSIPNTNSAHDLIAKNWKLPIKEASTDISVQKMLNASIWKRLNPSRNQAILMGNQGAPETGAKIWGLPKHDRTTAEWLHRSGFALGGLGGLNAHPMESQCRENLVLGTYEANTRMTRYEQSLKRVVKYLASLGNRYDIVGISYDDLACLQTSFSSYADKEIQDGLPFRPELPATADDIKKIQQEASEKQDLKVWTWWTPKLDWKVKFKMFPNSKPLSIIYQQLGISTNIEGQNYSDWYNHTFECFSRRDAMMFEMLLDVAVEDLVSDKAEEFLKKHLEGGA